MPGIKHFLRFFIGDTGKQVACILRNACIQGADAASDCVSDCEKQTGGETKRRRRGGITEQTDQRFDDEAGSGSVRELSTARTVQPESFHTRYA